MLDGNLPRSINIALSVELNPLHWQRSVNMVQWPNGPKSTTKAMHWHCHWLLFEHYTANAQYFVFCAFKVLSLTFWWTKCYSRMKSLRNFITERNVSTKLPGACPVIPKTVVFRYFSCPAKSMKVITFEDCSQTRTQSKFPWSGLLTTRPDESKPRMSFPTELCWTTSSVNDQIELWKILF